MSKISNELHVQKVCKMGQGKDCCSYLGMGSQGWECLKESELKPTIDARRKADTMTAKSDNCDGFDSFTKKNNGGQNVG